jgi:phosphinothricin acetyltransferase
VAEGRPDASVRAARREDLEAIGGIYQHYALNSHATFNIEPRPAAWLQSWFERHPATGPHRLLVATEGAVVLGYASSSSFRERPAYRTTVETSVYCHPDHTGRGIGTLLYQRLFDEIAAEDLHRAVAGITLPNDASVALHHRLGFTDVGTYTEVGYKFGRYWDVTWLEKPL